MKRTVLSSAVLVAGALLSISCARGEGRRADSPISTASGGVVDSLLPMPELVARLQARVARVDSLAGTSPSRDALVRRLLASLSRADTADLERAALTLGEFAWLYYPDHPYSRPPYEMPPEIAWIQYQANGMQGSERLLSRYAGRPLRLLGHGCEDSPARWNGNREWRSCTVRMVAEGRDTVHAQLFGSIVERGGRVKFVTYANKL